MKNLNDLPLIPLIFIYQGDFSHGGGGEFLIRAAAKEYLNTFHLPPAWAEGTIARTNQGKPYFEDGHLQFSVSHSRPKGLPGRPETWTCLMDTNRVGVDLQYPRKLAAGKMADRFLNPEEAAAVHDAASEREELDLFFRFWTRKEALAKFSGAGLFGEAVSRLPVRTGALRLEDGAYLTWCLDRESEPQIRELCL